MLVLSAALIPTPVAHLTGRYTLLRADVTHHCGSSSRRTGSRSANTSKDPPGLSLGSAHDWGLEVTWAAIVVPSARWHALADWLIR